MKETAHLLATFGLSSTQSKIYEFLLKQGSPKGVSKIAQGLKLHTQQIYNALPKLLEEEYVDVVKAGTWTKYIATNPARLRLRLEERRLSGEAIIDEMLKKYENNPRFETRVVIDKTEFMAHQYELLSKMRNDEICVYGTSGKRYNDYLDSELSRLDKERNKRLLSVRVVGSEEDHAYFKANQEVFGRLKHKYLKELPVGLTDTHIYPFGVMFNTYRGKEIYSVTIYNEEIAKDQKKFFEFLWKMSTG